MFKEEQRKPCGAKQFHLKEKKKKYRLYVWVLTAPFHSTDKLI
jgi:hypothetical protein